MPTSRMDGLADGKDEERSTTEATRDATYFFPRDFIILKVSSYFPFTPKTRSSILRRLKIYSSGYPYFTSWNIFSNPESYITHSLGQKTSTKKTPLSFKMTYQRKSFVTFYESSFLQWQIICEQLNCRPWCRCLRMISRETMCRRMSGYQFSRYRHSGVVWVYGTLRSTHSTLPLLSPRSQSLV